MELKKIEINQELLAKYVSKLDGVHQAVAFTTAVEAMNELVNIIENKIPTTKDHYGDYLSLATRLVDVAALLTAGANIDGVRAAARINGLL